MQVCMPLPQAPAVVRNRKLGVDGALVLFGGLVHFRQRFEEHHVLPRQIVILFDQLEAVGRDLLHDLLFAHLVQQLDRHLRILESELDEHHPPVGLEGPAHRAEHRFGMR